MKKLLISLVFISGCANQGVDRADQNAIIKEFHASIASMKKVKLSSNVQTGIAGGAVVGVIDELDGNHEDMIGGAIAGALVGGLFAAIFEGSNDAYEYKLNSQSEGDFTLIQKNLIDISSGCAKVRISNNANIYSAAKENCNVK